MTASATVSDLWEKLRDDQYLPDPRPHHPCHCPPTPPAKSAAVADKAEQSTSTVAGSLWEKLNDDQYLPDHYFSRPRSLLTEDANNSSSSYDGDVIVFVKDPVVVVPQKGLLPGVVKPLPSPPGSSTTEERSTDLTLMIDLESGSFSSEEKVFSGNENNRILVKQSCRHNASKTHASAGDIPNEVDPDDGDEEEEIIFSRDHEEDGAENNGGKDEYMASFHRSCGSLKFPGCNDSSQGDLDFDLEQATHHPNERRIHNLPKAHDQKGQIKKKTKTKKESDSPSTDDELESVSSQDSTTSRDYFLKEECDQISTKPRIKPFVILVASVAALGGLIFGYDMGNASATFLMPGFQQHVGWCEGGSSNCTAAQLHEINRDQGLINGLFCAGASLGAVLSPWVADTFGRRTCMFAAALVTLGSTLQASATTIAILQGARFVSGMGIGSLSMCAPVYIAELTPEHARGELSTLFQFGASFGLLTASIANLGLRYWVQGWRISYGGNLLFTVILLISLLFMPESPRWLVAHNREEEARVALNMTRYADEVEDEMDELICECQAEKERGVASWWEVWKVDNKMRYRLLIGIGLQCVQQFSGINAIMFYAPTILNKFVGSNMAVAGMCILTLTNFMSTFITVYVVDHAGRALLLIFGGVVMILALSANAFLSSMAATSVVGYFVLLFSAIFIIGYAASWGPVVWTVNAEFFPLRERGKANGLTTMSNWICATFVGAVFPIAQAASLPACFGFFAIVTYLGVLMVYFFMAETARKTILEIDQAFQKHQPMLFRKEWC